MSNSLQILKNKMFEGLENPALLKYVESMCKEKQRPLGKFNPWAWWVEIVRGCNLSCWHCPTRLLPKNELHVMEEETWLSLLKVIEECTPYGRLEFCLFGEPTLHPKFLEYVRIARKVVPHLQLLTYTNGTKIIDGSLSYRDMFDAGLNMVFVDMYAPFENHRKLAEESGFLWYHQDSKPKDAPSVFTNHKNPDLHAIMLAENPSNWTKRKSGSGYFTTFLNNLDWKIASKHGVKPVTSAPARRCDMTTKFVSIQHDGAFVFCCFDFQRCTVNYFGNIKNGTESFLNFWLSQYMQDTRKKLYNKDRSSHEYCQICEFTSIRCDIPHWKEEEMFDLFWNGKEWKET